MDEERFTELEIKLAYQEDLLQTLNLIVIEQQTQISQLEESCKLLVKRIKSIGGNEMIDTGLEVPPHY
ncbi:MAG: SlyX family protein [Methylococcales symbiont of Hymedesmia sp. n. MRB-2018]|nr:MAG: SlyX family protein [Methylococcales symbiont of Hymedesmia sp. n. MRB-2018]KAF3984131.1 MAG: SlyX family protein [Methylococcales symbiont of Hymedesmia sp. n. MRB-2018]